MEEELAHGAGVLVHARIGDRVEKGDRLCTIHARSEEDARRAAATLNAAYRLTDGPAAVPDLIHERIG